MNIGKIQYLRGELDKECIDLEELSEIEEAFKLIPDEELRDLRENATASDMLDEIESRVSKMERIIYDWVAENFGDNEAFDPSWDIGLLAERINSIPLTIGTKDYILKDLLDGERYELDNNN